MGVANGGLWEQFLSCQAPNQYGSWGVLEYMEQDRSTAPKHQALQNYINRCVFRHLQPVCRMYGDEVVLSKLQFRLLYTLPKTTCITFQECDQFGRKALYVC